MGLESHPEKMKISPRVKVCIVIPPAIFRAEDAKESIEMLNIESALII